MEVKPVFVYIGNERIAAVLHLPKGEGRFPVVITCHGLFSSKDSWKYTQIAGEFAREGLAVLRFDFRGCGESEGQLEDTTLTSRVVDLKAVLDFVQRQPELDGQMGVLGSSLGGCVAILMALRDQNIKAVVTWATPAYLTELFREEDFAGGYYRSGEFRLKRAFWEDLHQYDLVQAIDRLSCPILIIHGEADQQVPVHHAHALYEGVRGIKRRKIIPGGDHRLSHPSHREQAIRLSLDWFQEHLGLRR